MTALGEGTPFVPSTHWLEEKGSWEPADEDADPFGSPDRTITLPDLENVDGVSASGSKSVYPDPRLEMRCAVGVSAVFSSPVLSGASASALSTSRLNSSALAGLGWMIYSTIWRTEDDDLVSRIGKWVLGVHRT